MWTNQAICRLTGLSQATVSRVRSGHQRPGLDTMIKIQRGLGWSISDQIRAHVRDVYAPAFREWLDETADSDPETLSDPRYRVAAGAEESLAG